MSRGVASSPFPDFFGCLVIQWMAEIHFAPPKKPWNDNFLVNTRQAMVFHGFKGVQDFVHAQYLVPQRVPTGAMLAFFGTPSRDLLLETT